ncbi:S49 family peptidase, partial [Mesorhizobium sp.]|uniref:S49 family peptidase n=1 Tax=Mesorhizobium sp. TaxID=1871066 RepID=UPI0025C31431
MGASSGLTSYEGIGFQLKEAAADPAVRSVILDMHSPGGEAAGAFETAALVRDLAASKRTVAVVNGMAASAMYAIGSGATEIVTTETGISGSIGVVLLHADFSRQLDREGITPTLIHAGAHKVDGNPFEPLSDAVREDLQAEVDAFYASFLATVARGRGNRLTAAAARKTEARTFIGQAAVDAGIADRVGSFESVLADLTRAPGRSTSQPRRTSMSEKSGAPAAEDDAGIPKADHDAAVMRAASPFTPSAESAATRRSVAALAPAASPSARPSARPAFTA